MKKGSVGFKPENLSQPDIPNTWKAMEGLHDSGKARAIGVSNFSTKKLGDLLAIARVPPAVNQVECHPSWHQQKLHAFCKSKGIHLTVSVLCFKQLTVCLGVCKGYHCKLILTFMCILSTILMNSPYCRGTRHWAPQVYDLSRVTFSRIQLSPW